MTYWLKHATIQFQWWDEFKDEHQPHEQYMWYCLIKAAQKGELDYLNEPAPPENSDLEMLREA